MAARWPARSVACRASMASCEARWQPASAHTPVGARIPGCCLLPSVQPGLGAALLLGRCWPWEGSACTWVLRLTPQSHGANKSICSPAPASVWPSVCPCRPSCSGWGFPHSPNSPPHPSPKEGLLDQSSRSFQACCQRCPCWRPGSGTGSHREPSWLRRTLSGLQLAQGTSQIATNHEQSSSGPCAATRLRFRGPGSGSTEPTCSVVWWGLCLQE